MRSLPPKPSIPYKAIDYMHVKRTVEELEGIINTRGPGYAKARYELYVLRRQAIREQNRKEKAAKVGFWAEPQEYFYIPQAVNYY